MLYYSVCNSWTQGVRRERAKARKGAQSSKLKGEIVGIVEVVETVEIVKIVKTVEVVKSARS